MILSKGSSTNIFIVTVIALLVSTWTHAQTLDIAEGRFQKIKSKNSLEVDFDGRIVTMKFSEDTKVLAGGRRIKINGLLDESRILITYKHFTTGKGVIAQCTTAQSCEAVKIELEFVSGLWRMDFLFGVEFSQERNDFSEQDLVLAYASDTLVASSLWKLNRFHFFFDAGLITIPNEEEDKLAAPEENPNDTGGATMSNGGEEGEKPSAFDTFLASRKSLSLGGGFYNAWSWDLGGEDVLNFGLIYRGGVHTVTQFDEDSIAGTDISTKAVGTEDTAKWFSTGGIRFAHHKKTLTGTNPEVLRFVEANYGYYENFLSSEELAGLGLEDQGSRRWRFVINSQARFPGSVPLYVGLRANLGRGKDDFRIHAALRLDLDKLAALVPR